MAKIQSEALVITFSKLVKDTDSTETGVITAELLESLSAVAEELAGAGVIVEINVA